MCIEARLWNDLFAIMEQLACSMSYITSVQQYTIYKLFVPNILSIKDHKNASQTNSFEETDYHLMLIGATI